MKLIDLNVSIKLDNNEKVIELFNNIESDIITLQEVMRGIDNNVYPRYNNSNIIKDNEQGNEVISKYPIIEAENIFFHKNYAPFIETTNFRKEDHPRALERVVLQVDDKKLQILNLHGIWNEGKVGDNRTLNECEFVLKVALDKDLPTIITGDFNLNPTSESIKLINKKFKNLINSYNIISTRPVVRDGLDKGEGVDDYIFVNNKIKVNDFKVLETDTSDHYPLILDFDIVD